MGAVADCAGRTNDAPVCESFRNLVIASPFLWCSSEAARRFGHRFRRCVKDAVAQAPLGLRPLSAAATKPSAKCGAQGYVERPAAVRGHTPDTSRCDRTELRRENRIGLHGTPFWSWLALIRQKRSTLGSRAKRPNFRYF